MTKILRPGDRLVVATHNPGKVPELAALLEGRFDLVSAGELGLPEPEETETTFAGNALLKARHAAGLANLPALADDSGLSVAGLNGAPGVYSARWAGPSKDFKVAMDRIERELGEGPDRRAWFSCALAVAWPGLGDENIVEEGRVFGYDPIFVPDGGEQTFGEMDPTAKDAISHRARAFAKLKARLF
jgi:XTP/dITP diphosphohydrolase